MIKIPGEQAQTQAARPVVTTVANERIKENKDKRAVSHPELYRALSQTARIIVAWVNFV